MATIANPTAPVMHRKPVATYQPTYAPQPPATAAAQHAVMNTSGARNPPAGYPNPPSPYSASSQSRRTLSNATSSTSSTTHNNGSTNNPRISTAGYGSSIKRSTSSRSAQSASPTSYVALMRKQKATVWCDRAQHQDPRILAAQRQAKMRAVMEVAGGHNHSSQARVSASSSGITGGVRSKIRHHGAPKAKDYSAGNMSGAGVPMRLSATEVDDEDSDDEQKAYHRTSSSRSSTGNSNPYSNHRGHEASPPNATSPNDSLGDVAEEETPMPGRLGGQPDYFGSSASNGDVEEEKNFGGVPGLPKTRQRSDSEHMSADELRRRGSVDDRTMTMSAGRLFVANPDLSD